MEVLKHIPKKYWKDIKRTYVELDFTTRTVRRYFVDFKDGTYISVTDVDGLKRAIAKKYKERK